MKTHTKKSLSEMLVAIRERGWIPNARHGNDGGIGNTLEDLLGIQENNLPIPNAAEWELKCQRAKTASLTTLLHTEPSPRAMKLVPSMLLPLYGWPHKEAGRKYPENEVSFRQTINVPNKTDRGFGIKINQAERKIETTFDANAVDKRHSAWLTEVKKKVGLGELSPQPYWGFDDVFHAVAAKLHNCFYVKADVKKEGGRELYHYKDIKILSRVSLEKFLAALENGLILVDFDARSGHNHGTKFRIRQNAFDELYDEVTEI